MRGPGDAFFGKPAHSAWVFVGAILDRPPKFVEFRSCLPQSAKADSHLTEGAKAFALRRQILRGKISGRPRVARACQKSR